MIAASFCSIRGGEQGGHVYQCPKVHINLILAVFCPVADEIGSPFPEIDHPLDAGIVDQHVQVPEPVNRPGV
jgi:hypothetical protein